jgi:hypothetical protein
MRHALHLLAVGLLLLMPGTALAQTADQTSGLTCTPVAAAAQSTVSCAVDGLAPASQYSWSVTLPGAVLVDGAGVAAADGTSAFQFGAGAAAGAYLTSVTGTAADGAGFSAEVSGTVTAPAPTGPIAAGFGPGTANIALAGLLLALAIGFTVFALRPSRARAR